MTEPKGNLPKPLLLLKNKKTGQQERYQLDQETISIGRDRSCYVVLEDRTVSRHHAEILQTGNQYFVQDVGSNNGTLLNKRPLPPREKKLLGAGDIIKIEDFELSFFLPSSATGDDFNETTDTDILEIKMVKKLLRAMDREQAPSLEVIEGPLVGTHYTLEGKNQEVLIGRDPACEFSIDSDVISRKHARLSKRWDTVSLTDLGSKNGVYVNKEKIKEKQIHDGDIIHLGTLAFSFRNPQELSLEIVAPPAKSTTDQTSPEIPLSSAAPSAASRAVTKKGDEPEVEEAKAELPVPESIPPEAQEEPEEQSATAHHRFRLSAMEIFFGLLGLAVVTVSVWGLWILLK